MNVWLHKTVLVTTRVAIDSLANSMAQGRCARRAEPCGYLIWPNPGSPMEQRTKEKIYGTGKELKHAQKWLCIECRDTLEGCL